MKLIEKYFPDLSDSKKENLQQLKEIYSFWNNQINVISRKDMDAFYERHVLHSMAISKFTSFNKSSSILDIGTGGGFPGIPLAILFPESNFLLVDSIGKKIKVVNAVKNKLNLTNVKAVQSRGEDISGSFDFIISRAVTRLNKFLPWTEGKIKKSQNHSIKNGIIYLKGGDINEEINELSLNKKPSINQISNYFEEPFFETKIIVHIPI